MTQKPVGSSKEFKRQIRHCEMVVDYQCHNIHEVTKPLVNNISRNDYLRKANGHKLVTQLEKIDYSGEEQFYTFLHYIPLFHCTGLELLLPYCLNYLWHRFNKVLEILRFWPILT